MNFFFEIEVSSDIVQFSLLVGFLVLVILQNQSGIRGPVHPRGVAFLQSVQTAVGLPGRHDNNAAKVRVPNKIFGVFAQKYAILDRNLHRSGRFNVAHQDLFGPNADASRLAFSESP
jgi:hypothetical protein